MKWAELIEVIEKNTETHEKEKAIITAVQEWYRSQHDGKPIVSGSFCGCNTINYGYCTPVCFSCNKPVKVEAK